jgi:hypothetical protein
MEPIDVLIPLGPNDMELVDIVAKAARNFVSGVRNIYIIGRVNPNVPDTIFVSEDVLPFNIRSVQDIIGSKTRAGWYLQQLAKLYFPFVHQPCLPRYLVVDADTVFLRTCSFADGARTVFNVGTEFHRPYFAHMRRLHPQLRKMIAYSGVTHCMLFDKAWISELFSLVEAYHNHASPWRQTQIAARKWLSRAGIAAPDTYRKVHPLPPPEKYAPAGAHKPFWRIFLESVAPAHRAGSGASEYEIYFNFCLNAHMGGVLVKKLEWANIRSEEEAAPELYDYVSLHHRRRAANFDKEALMTKISGETGGGKAEPASRIPVTPANERNDVLAASNR